MDPASSPPQHHISDVGKILLHATQELAKVRESLGTKSKPQSVLADAVTALNGSSSGMTPSGSRSALSAATASMAALETNTKDELDRIIAAAEAELQAKAETVLNVSADKATSLPNDFLVATSSTAFAPRHSYHSSSTSPPPLGNSSTRYSSSSQSSKTPYLPKSNVVRRRASAPATRRSDGKNRSLTEQINEQAVARGLSDPTNPSTIDLVLARHGLEKPANFTGFIGRPPVQSRTSVRSRRKRASAVQATSPDQSRPQRRSASVAQPNTILPAINRKDPNAPPPSLPDRELAKAGVMDLVNRGFIPRGVDYSAALHPIQGTAVNMGDPSGKSDHAWLDDNLFGFNFSNVKLDLTTDNTIKATPRGGAPPPGQRLPTHSPRDDTDLLLAGASGEAIVYPHKNTGRKAASKADSHPPPSPIERAPSKPEASQPFQETRPFTALMDTYSLHNFVIRKGRALTVTPEFASFRRKYAAIWGSISVLIRQMETLFGYFAVPLAYVSGTRLVELARDELQLPSVDELLSAVVNAAEVDPLIKIPGRRYRGVNGKEAAATKIQATWKMLKTRRATHAALHRHRAAGIIQRAWVSAWNIRSTRAELARRREEEKDIFDQVQARFAKAWDSGLPSRPHVVVHIPSMSVGKSQRETMDYLTSRQAGQLARLCDLADPNVSIIYVSPNPVTEELLQYYYRLLEVGGVKDAKSRIRFIVPENAPRFHPSITLSCALLYSPRAMARLRNFVRGREAYIVPGSTTSRTEVQLCVALGVPLFAGSDRAAMAFSSKSGARRIFTEADINIPTGETDIYTQDDLVSALARLAAAHPSVQQWIVKLDDESSGRGHAVFVPNNSLRSHAKAVRDSKADPITWARPETQDAVRRVLASELKQGLATAFVLCDTRAYPTWEHYVSNGIERVGAVVEAAPSLDHVHASPSGNITIEPTGRVIVLSTQDQILAPVSAPLYAFRAIGSTFPQASVPPAALNSALRAIGKACFRHGIVGHVGVDFLAFQDPVTRRQKLLAVDLNLRPTDSWLSFKLFNFTLQGSFDVASGYYSVKRASAFDRADSLRRYCTSVDWLSHSALDLMSYSVLFGTCRSAGIAFDLQESFGTVFALKDGFSRGVLGMQTIGRSLPESLRSFAENLAFLRKTLASSAPAHESVTNMKDVAKIISRFMEKLNLDPAPIAESPPARLNPGQAEAAAAAAGALPLSHSPEVVGISPRSQH